MSEVSQTRESGRETVESSSCIPRGVEWRVTALVGTLSSTAIHSGAGAEAEPVIIIQISLLALTDRASLQEPCGGNRCSSSHDDCRPPHQRYPFILFERLAFLT